MGNIRSLDRNLLRNTYNSKKTLQVKSASVHHAPYWTGRGVGCDHSLVSRGSYLRLDFKGPAPSLTQATRKVQKTAHTVQQQTMHGGMSLTTCATDKQRTGQRSACLLSRDRVQSDLKFFNSTTTPESESDLQFTSGRPLSLSLTW